jgi:hypothetical protein
MIRKPGPDWQTGEDALVRAVQSTTRIAKGSVNVARKGGHLARGLFCWFLAILWGWAALAGGLLGGSLPTLVGVGAMAAFMAWAGRRAFRKARESLS